MDGSDLPRPAGRDAPGRDGPGRDAFGRFTTGNPGRPFGSRNRCSKRVARAILRDFEAHQDELLPRLRDWFVPQYVQLVARLLPRVDEAGGAELDAMGETDVAAVLAEARAAIARIDAGQGTIEDLEAALLGERHAPGAVVIGD